MPTKIEWAEETWNPVTGCSPISEGCQHCWAKRMAKRLAGRFGYPRDDPFRVTLHPDKLEQPLHWKKPRLIFVCSMSDFFHPAIPFEYQNAILRVIRRCPQHTFMILTKRAEQLAMWDHICGWDPLPNLWLGVTVENQQRAEERIPILLQTPAIVHFVSVEPCLSAIDLTPWLGSCPECGGSGYVADGYGGGEFCGCNGPLDWVICGGETGPGARPMQPKWVRSLRDQCQKVGVPFFFKQWGEYAPVFDSCTSENSYTMMRLGKKDAGRELDGRIWDEYPDVEGI